MDNDYGIVMNALTGAGIEWAEASRLANFEIVMEVACHDPRYVGERVDGRIVLDDGANGRMVVTPMTYIERNEPQLDEIIFAMLDIAASGSDSPAIADGSYFRALRSLFSRYRDDNKELCKALFSMTYLRPEDDE